MKNLKPSLFRKTFLFAILFSMINWANAQDFVKELEKQYNVKIDSSFIKATPYKQIEKDGVIYDEDKKIDFYNNITIYEIKANSEKSKGGVNREIEAIKPAIFMLPGGGFIDWSEFDTMGMNTLGPLSLGSKLSTQLNSNVYIINYVLVDTQKQIVKNLVFPYDNMLCVNFQNQRAKALLLDGSYKAFHDLRKILKLNFLDSAAQKQIDPNNFFMIGSSAGAVLALNTLFLQKNEIPGRITYNKGCPNTTGVDTIKIDTTKIRDQYWPIPTMKGIVAMTGAWIYDNVTHLTDNTPSSSLNTPLYMMHGTCDELISRREGRIGFKMFKTNVWGIPIDLISNTLNSSWFVNGKGSEYIFNAFKDTHCKMIYGQVMRGSHGVFSRENTQSAWDVITSTYPKDTVTAQIRPFIQDLINGTSNFSTHTRVLYPDKVSDYCLSTDDSLGIITYSSDIPTPTITYDNNICNNTSSNTYTATLGNLPSTPYSIVWSSTGNITLINPPFTSNSVSYKAAGPNNNSGTIKATITKGCNVKVFNYNVNVNANKVDTINMTSYCYSGVMGTTAREQPAGAQLIFFQSFYRNAVQDGITAMQWEMVCGGSPVTLGVINQMVGNDLKSSGLTGPTPNNCTQVRVRYLRPCGQYSNWFYGYMKDCPGWVDPYLKVYPNPTNDYFSISLEEGKIIESKEGITVFLVDAMGNEVFKTMIYSTEEKINISDLKPDVYKVVVLYQDKSYFSTLIKN